VAKNETEPSPRGPDQRGRLPKADVEINPFSKNSKRRKKAQELQLV
jgi:hypothetical protein